MESKPRPQVAIVGAGFSGLVAAWRLEKEGFDVTVFEKSSEAGGLIQSRHHTRGLLETAANGFLSSKLVEELFEDCGLIPQVPKKSARRRFLAVSGEITRFPLTLIEAFETALKALSAKKHPPTPGESLSSWADRALGLAMSRKIVGTAMLGIYASEPQSLSANLIVGRFYDRSRSRNERGRLRGTVSSELGMGGLLNKLRAKIEERGVKILMSLEISAEVSGAASGLAQLERLREAGATVILATPAWEAARILKSLNSSSSRVAALDVIESVPLNSVTCFFNRKPPKTGFGTLFCQTAPEGENDGVLGALQNSEIFEGRSEEGVHSETWILGGRVHGQAMIESSDSNLIDRIMKKRERLIAVDSRTTLLEAVVTRWPKAIPHYSPDLEFVRQRLLQDEDGIVLFGNYLGELGLASILENAQCLSARVRQSQENTTGKTT